MNDLVAQEEGVGIDDLVSSLAILGPAVDSFSEFSSGDWTGGILSGLGAAVDVVSMAANPIATLASSAASMFMDLMPPFRKALDDLAGNPNAIEAKAQTWQNIQGSVGEIHNSFNSSVASVKGSWSGAAADAYGTFAKAYGDELVALKKLCGDVASNLRVASDIVAIIRGLVKDAIADLVGQLIQLAIEVGCTLGLAAPVAATQATTTAAKWANRIRTWLDKLTKAIRRLSTALKNLDSLLRGNIWQPLVRVAQKLDNAKAFETFTDVLDKLNLFHDVATVGARA